MNQLVGVLVGCILFFRAISYFVDKSMDQVASIENNKPMFSTQSIDRCAHYLSGSASFFSGRVVLSKIAGDCFDTPLVSPTKKTLKHRIQKITSHISGLLFPRK